MNKFFSRKLLVVVGGSVTVILVNLGLPEDLAVRISDVIQLAMCIYLPVQGAVDVVTEIRKK